MLGEWIFKTARPMETPAPYSAFHIVFAAAGIAAAALAAYGLSKRIREQTLYRILFFCGAALTASEVYKQLFLYYVVNGETYDWWYFPFQLCSLPMYFCLLLPFVRSRAARKVLCTFMQDFNLLGGVMALAEPSGFLHPYWALTVHGFLWHIALIFIGLLVGLGGGSDQSLRGYARTLPVFGACCAIASVINVTAVPLGQADMFYISPYYPTGQIVFHEIAVQFGVMAGNVCYLLAICAGGLIFHLLFGRAMSGAEGPAGCGGTEG